MISAALQPFSPLRVRLVAEASTGVGHGQGRAALAGLGLDHLWEEIRKVYEGMMISSCGYWEMVNGINNSV